MDFFDIVGSVGRWQYRILIILIYFNVVSMWQNFAIVFQAPNMDFRCIQPSSGQHYSNASAVVFDNRCEVPLEENSTTLVPCTEWEYDTSYTSETIVSEWDLVCSREWLVSFAKSIYMVGFLLSVLIFGQISDLFLPESPRWLLTKGKREKLKKLLTKAAAVNGRDAQEVIKNLDLLKENEGKRTPTLFEVLKMKKMRKRFFNMAYQWMVNAFLYYAFSYNTNDLAGNAYLNFFIYGLLEFPSYALVLWGIKRWGRRPTHVSLMLAGGVCCAAILPVPADMAWLSTTFAMFGKFCITGSFGLLYLYTTEVFPTGVRNVSLGSCSMCARIGSILGPFARDLGKATHAAVPNSLYTFLALTSGLLALLLPETRGLDLPDTLQEGEDLGETSNKFGKDITDIEGDSFKR